jgi:hypothetical protein
MILWFSWNQNKCMVTRRSSRWRIYHSNRSCWYQTWRNWCYYCFFWKNYKRSYIAAEELAKKNFMWIVDLRTVRPMDHVILTSVKKTNRLVVLEGLGLLQVLLQIIYCSRACFWLSWCTNTKNYNCWHTSTLFSVLLKEWLPNMMW